MQGNRVLVAAHGNSLRALIMVLEKHSPESIMKRELATGAPVIYRLKATRRSESVTDLRRLSLPHAPCGGAPQASAGLP